MFMVKNCVCVWEKSCVFTFREILLDIGDKSVVLSLQLSLKF